MTAIDYIEAEELEIFISSNKPTTRYTLSYTALDDGKNMYTKLKNKTGPTYEVFSVSGHGYTEHLLYKSRNGDIHVVEIFIYTPKSYSIVTDEKWFHNRIINK